MKRILTAFVVVILLFAGTVFVSAEETTTGMGKIINEIKQWDFSIGGYAYLFNAEASYYSAGAKRDLGQFFNWLDEERLYFEIGYLNTHMVGDEADVGEKTFGYIGLSTNANYLVQCGINGLNKLVNAKFTSPEIFNKILAIVGIVGAKKIDSTLWTLDEGYDYGINISVIKFNW